ncbi:hypothetical protein Tcan_00978, partial [Toxocara canis]
KKKAEVNKLLNLFYLPVKSIILANGENKNSKLQLPHRFNWLSANSFTKLQPPKVQCTTTLIHNRSKKCEQFKYDNCFRNACTMRTITKKVGSSLFRRQENDQCEMIKIDEQISETLKVSEIL